MKKICLILALLFLVGCGGYQPEITATDPVEIAVSKAIFHHNKKEDAKCDAYGEGHIVLGTEEKEGKIFAYTVASYGEYSEKDGAMCRTSGTGIVPVVIVLDEDYNLIEVKEVIMYDLDSLSELFPEEYQDRVINQPQEDFTAITAMEADYISRYLEDSGKEMTIKY